MCEEKGIEGRESVQDISAMPNKFRINNQFFLILVLGSFGFSAAGYFASPYYYFLTGNNIPSRANLSTNSFYKMPE